MAQNQNLKNRVLTALNCSTSLPEAKHFCENPVVLSCGHYICNDCLPIGLNSKSVKCNICGNTNERDLNQKLESQSFYVIFDQNINELFDVTLDNFRNTFERCKEMIYNYEERIENHIQFIKDNILIRVECVKMELDNLNEAFSKELDETEKKWKLECKNINIEKFDRKAFEDVLKKLENDINERRNINQKSIYEYQKQLRNIQQIIKEYKENAPSLDFKESDVKLSREIIGELIFNKNFLEYRQVINRIKDNKYKHFDIASNLYDFCVLPNGNFIFTNYESSNLLFYDNNMNLIKKINTINNKKCKIISLTNDENNNLYLSDYSNHLVIKTDVQFNVIKTFGNGIGNATNELDGPRGIAYYNQQVFVCDFYNTRILKLDSELVYQASYIFTYRPWCIKIVENVAIVRPSGELSIYFYDLSNFNLLKKHEGHKGFIGASSSCFYEYYAPNKMFYCYDKNGNLLESVETSGFGLSSLNGYGSICIFNSKIFISSYENPILVEI